MPKLKRSPDDTRGGTDFIESLDRGASDPKIKAVLYD